MKKEYDLLTVGFPMVEIMRKERGVTFGEVGDFVGPYPSADTCILLDVAARLGARCCFLGVTAEDTYGDVVMNRLKADGVDVSYVRTIPQKDTTIVFVRYEEDGTREYLPSFADTVSIEFCPDDIDPEVVKKARCVHFSGEVIMICADDKRRRALLKLLESIDEDTLVSLDPNFTEWNTDVKKMLAPFVDRANILFPSEGEASRMMEMDTDEEACTLLAEQGKIVAYKRGKNGCEIYSGKEKLHADAFVIKEVDPTGCGDSFCAGFLTGILEGLPLERAGKLANAAGALQATRLGPMEGAMYRKDVEDFIKERECE
ncbi:MAG: sugar kinase [Lachnospiraceae bacterium]|nr:sugar kinase [Lachnospiraceae bacterium]